MFFADFYHADSVGDDGEDAEPDGNVVVVINVINNPHHKGDDYYPFEPHNVFGVNIPGEHHGGNNRKPGYGVRGYGGDRKNHLKDYNTDFKPNGAFPFCDDKVSHNADKGCDGTAVSSKKKMGKGVEPELKGLHDDIALFVFDKTDEHHNNATHKGNKVSEKDIHLFFLCFSGFFNLIHAVASGTYGESIECCGNKVEVNCVVNKPKAKGYSHNGFEFDDVFAVDYPGEGNSCDNREPGYGIKGKGIQRKTDGNRHKKEFKRNRGFKFGKNKVSCKAYEAGDDSAGSAKKIVRNCHKDELNALGKKDLCSVFDKTGEHHDSAGNY